MFSIKLKELREKAGLSQYSFADAFGVAQSTVGGWESGKREPNFETMQRLADFFDVSIDFLLGRNEKNSPISNKPTEEDLKIALFGGDKDVTEEMWAEVKSFAEYVKQKSKK